MHHLHALYWRQYRKKKGKGGLTEIFKVYTTYTAYSIYIAEAKWTAVRRLRVILLDLWGSCNFIYALLCLLLHWQSCASRLNTIYI